MLNYNEMVASMAISANVMIYLECFWYVLNLMKYHCSVS